MFSSLFGGKRKLSFIRELLEQRMEVTIVQQLGNLQLLSTPEGTVFTIIETVVKLQKQGVLLHRILHTIENHRQRIGHNHSDFNEILKTSMGESPGVSVPAYCNYRISLEHPGCLTDEQAEKVIEKCVLEITNK